MLGSVKFSSNIPPFKNMVLKYKNDFYLISKFKSYVSEVELLSTILRTFIFDRSVQCYNVVLLFFFKKDQKVHPF